MISIQYNEMVQPFREVFRRMAVPFFLFFLVLTTLLFLSWIFLLPILTRTEVHGESKNIRDLITYRKELQSDVSRVRRNRNQLVLPGQDPLYNVLKQEKHKKVSFSSLRREILRTALSHSSVVKDAVRISFIQYDAARDMLTLEGSVFAGASSTTVLAEFIDALQALPWIYVIEQPDFLRQKNEHGEIFSPFSLDISLHVSVLRETFPVL